MFAKSTRCVVLEEIGLHSEPSCSSKDILVEVRIGENALQAHCDFGIQRLEVGVGMPIERHICNWSID